MTLVLFLEIVFNKDVNTKIISSFLFLYFFIPFLNISTYRGNVEFKTIVLYSISNIFIILILIFFSKKKKYIKKITYIKSNVNLYIFTFSHLIIAYLFVAYLYIFYGNILVNQEIRFAISPSVGYIIKSTIYIPLIFILMKEKKTSVFYFVFIFLPLLPAFLIGSRGSVIMIVLGLLIILFLMVLEKKIFANQINIKYKELSKRDIILGMSLSATVLYAIFFVRRLGSKVYISSAELVKKYFDVSIPPIFIYMILPLYLNLRETVGISNNIITNNLKTDSTIPMFFLELFTILPGKQMSPGITLGNLIGKSGDAGLTPGIIGGVFLDIGYLTVFVPAIFILIITYLYKRSFTDDNFKVIYILSLIQFFHVYHRGFLKIEYFISFLIIFVYLSLSGSFKIFNNEDSTHSVSINT
tara:strand:- start:2 stop:1240 length:1239 start_codon:yes stop_codon:yes gene_type:complete